MDENKNEMIPENAPGNVPENMPENMPDSAQENAVPAASETGMKTIDGVTYFGDPMSDGGHQAQAGAQNADPWGNVPGVRKSKGARAGNAFRNVIGGLGRFWKKNKRNKAIMIFCGLILIGMIGNLSGGSGGSSTSTDETYEWPNNELAQMIPEPNGTITDMYYSKGEYLEADVEDFSKSGYTEYRAGCEEKGFTQVMDESQSGGSYDYIALNGDGYYLWLNYDSDFEELDIKLYSPDYAAENVEDYPGAQTEEADTAESSDADSSGVTPDFKATMDSYEEFMNSYVDFMQKYENSDNTAAMLQDYTSFMSKYSDYMTKIDAIDENSLSAADLAYYNAVNARVLAKLATVS